MSLAYIFFPFAHRVCGRKMEKELWKKEEELTELRGTDRNTANLENELRQRQDEVAQLLV